MTSENSNESKKDKKADAANKSPAKPKVKVRKMTFYDVLGVSEKATRKDIRRAYIFLAKKYHPDKIDRSNEEMVKQHFDKMSIINKAYRILRNDKTRKEYDEFLHNQNTQPSETDK